MSFQILNPQGIAIPLSVLDQEACDFWKVEKHEKYYAHPNLPSHYTNNWFDSIGWAIHNPGRYTHFGWEDVKCTLWTIQVKGLFRYLSPKTKESITEHKTIEEALDGIYTFLKPYYDLIDHWESKGYIPKEIKE